jgi:FtsP/CotA-like multicopper oxidase with cupredoxin domain
VRWTNTLSFDNTWRVVERQGIGGLQVWDVINDTMMDHPFHLHGFFFQVVEENGNPPAFRSWEDIVNIRPRAECASRGCLTTGWGSGCTMAISSSITRRA